eukprot:300583_1
MGNETPAMTTSSSMHMGEKHKKGNMMSTILKQHVLNPLKQQNRNSIATNHPKVRQKPQNWVYHTETALSLENKSIIVPVTVTLTGDWTDRFIVYASKIDNDSTVMKVVQQRLEEKCPNYLHLKITKMEHSDGRRTFVDDSLSTSYNLVSLVISKIYVEVKSYIHYTKAEAITCEHMNKFDSVDPLNCPVYKQMKIEYEWNEINLNHMNEFTHFIDEYAEKPECKYNDSCTAYKRMEAGANKMDDLCHLKLYKHPPRRRNISLDDKTHPLIVNRNVRQSQGIYVPTFQEEVYVNAEDGYMFFLIKEVIRNGFKSDLCLKCNVNDDCEHKERSILNIVNDKMDCKRHGFMKYPLNKGEILSLVLYTGCECN